MGRADAIPVPLQDEPLSGADPHDDGSGRPSVGAQQEVRLGRPPVHPPRGAVPAPRPQLVGPAYVPQVAVQIEAEPPTGVRVRMARGGGVGRRAVPQGEADPLAGVRPRRCRPGHQVQRAGAIAARVGIAGQGDGQAGAEQPVGGDPRHVPAQEVGGEMAQVGPEPGGEFRAVGARHGTRREIDVDARGGARPRPVADETAGGRRLDHGQRHGELSHARPEGEAGIPERGVGEHQHSPCADGSPNL